MASTVGHSSKRNFIFYLSCEKQISGSLHTITDLIAVSGLVNDRVFEEDTQFFTTDPTEKNDLGESVDIRIR